MNDKHASKYLSLVLRHAPEKAGLTLDEGGWADLDTLLANGPKGLTREVVERVVAESDKQRFSLVPAPDGGARIRANQGHSVPVDLGLTPVEPPEHLYHGTYRAAVAAIEETGLSKMRRHHVHLAAETGTAVTVGMRTGTPVLFRVRAGAMHRDGFPFFRSTNGVWLTDHVPPRYLERVETQS